MLLSELHALDAKKLEDSVFGILVDKYDSKVINKLKEIGIILKLDEEGEIDLDTIDVVLSYINQGVKVVLEVSSETDIAPNELLSVAKSIGSDVSLLPPSRGSSAELKDAYINNLCEYAEKWITDNGMKIQLLPVNGFLEYLLTKDLYKRNSITENEYFDKEYVEGISEGYMDKIKCKLEQVINESLGGISRVKVLRNSVAFALTKSQ